MNILFTDLVLTVKENSDLINATELAIYAFTGFSSIQEFHDNYLKKIDQEEKARKAG